MKKATVLPAISLTSAVMAIISIAFNFIYVPGCKPISGINLLTHLYKSVTLSAITPNNDGTILIFRSCSIFLLISVILFAISAVILTIYLVKREKKILNLSLFFVCISYLTFCIQIFNSKLFVSDFFGVLSSGFKGKNGSLVYFVPDFSGDSTGIGARLFAIFGVIALISVIIAKLSEYAQRIKVEQLHTPASIAFKQFMRNKLSLIGLCVLVAILLICFYGPVFAKDGLLATNIQNSKLPPSWHNIFGTDTCGRDIFTRILYGGRISLEVGFIVVFAEIAIGTVIGGISGYYGKWVDNVLMRVVDIFLSIPMLPVVIIIGAVMMDLQVPPENRIYYLMIILALFFWPSAARLIRGQILSLREQEFMVAANALGLRDRTKIFLHLIPNALPNVIVTATLDIGGVILTESALSFLGLGVAIPYPSWGNIVNAVNDPLNYDRPWLWIPAGVMILITVLCINLVGDGLRDANDPKMNR